MRQVANARPGLAGVGRAARMGAVAVANQPVALEIIKNGRSIKPFKVVPLGGEMVLGQVVRNQQGTEKAISVPLIVLNFAEKAGVRWFVWRHDRHMEMRRVLISELRCRGQLRANHEVYLPLDFMQVVPWQGWRFAERVISLGPTVPEPAGQQPPLPGFGG